MHKYLSRDTPTLWKPRAPAVGRTHHYVCDFVNTSKSTETRENCSWASSQHLISVYLICKQFSGKRDIWKQRLYVLLIPMLRTLDHFWLRTLTFDSRKLIEPRPFRSYSYAKQTLGTNLLGDDLAAPRLEPAALHTDKSKVPDSRHLVPIALFVIYLTENTLFLKTRFQMKTVPKKVFFF